MKIPDFHLRIINNLQLFSEEDPFHSSNLPAKQVRPRRPMLRELEVCEW
jgi:hypothetical protein